MIDKKDLKEFKVYQPILKKQTGASNKGVS
jgi:hypothetical protein